MKRKNTHIRRAAAQQKTNIAAFSVKPWKIPLTLIAAAYIPDARARRTNN
jgi:hypothetical protein